MTKTMELMLNFQKKYPEAGTDSLLSDLILKIREEEQIRKLYTSVGNLRTYLERNLPLSISCEEVEIITEKLSRYLNEND